MTLCKRKKKRNPSKLLQIEFAQPVSRGVVGGLGGGAGWSVCPGFTHWRHPSPRSLLVGRFDASSRLGSGPPAGVQSVHRPVGRRRAAEPQPCHSRAGLTSIGLEARIPHRSPRTAPITKRESEHVHTRDKWHQSRFLTVLLLVL